MTSMVLISSWLHDYLLIYMIPEILATFFQKILRSFHLGYRGLKKYKKTHMLKKY